MAMVQDGQVAADEKGCSASPALVSTLLVLFLVKACAVMLDTIWPLFLKAHFGWQEREYSLLLFSQSVSSILFLAVFPSIIRWLGDAMTLLLLGLAAAVTMGLAFALQSPAGLALPGHVALMLLTYGVLNTMDPCVKAVASSLVPPSAQGRTFAALNICSALGSMLSGLVAPRLYERCAPPAPSMPRAPCAVPPYLCQRALHRIPRFATLRGAVLSGAPSGRWPSTRQCRSTRL